MASRLPSFLVKQRRLFQRGLLGWLRTQARDARPRVIVAGVTVFGQGVKALFFIPAGVFGG